MSKTTNCTGCGKEIQYVTKRPIKCSACRISSPEKPKKKRGKPKSSTKGASRTYNNPKGKTSSSERQMCFELNNIIHGAQWVNGGYYSFLPSPKGQPLQLDRYYPTLKLAFEYDGKQHTEFSKYFHKSKENFEYLQACDKLKDGLCIKQGITLVRIDHNMKLTGENLCKRIREENEDLYLLLIKQGLLKEFKGDK